ncbi:MAG: hypothetical protein H6551_01170 [Chitinophagales bacterium]|nr:hypothetical protein [Chitinophagaceae bacterium]MCB9063735.1 hypothetical protein [Chitinophagales bacterium]
MRHVLIAILFLSRLTCSAQEYEQQLIEEKLKGNVKKVSYLYCHFSDTAQFKNIPKSIDEVLNIHDNCWRHYCVDSFNTHGYKILSYKSMDGNISLVSRIQYEFDEKNRKTKQQTFNGDTLVGLYYKYKYDTAGNLVQENSYVRDLQNKEIQERSITYKYEFGRLVGVTDSNCTDGAITRIIEYNYIKRYQIPVLQKILSSAYGGVDTTYYPYNERSNKILRYAAQTWGLPHTTYDEYDNPILQQYNGRDTVYSYKTVYIYDKFGNWILKVAEALKQGISIDFVAKDVIIREIEYY